MLIFRFQSCQEAVQNNNLNWEQILCDFRLKQPEDPFRFFDIKNVDAGKVAMNFRRFPLKFVKILSFFLVYLVSKISDRRELFDVISFFFRAAASGRRAPAKVSLLKFFRLFHGSYTRTIIVGT